MAADLLDRINDERARRNRPLVVKATVEPLASWAQTWARHMSNNGLSHSNLGTLLQEGGGQWNTAGEIIARGGKGVQSSAIHVAWMNSAEHRNIILSAAWSRISVGVWCDGSHNIWCCADFARLSSQGGVPAGAGGSTTVNPIARTDQSHLSC